MSKHIESRDHEIDLMMNDSNQTLLESKQLDILFENMMRNRYSQQPPYRSPSSEPISKENNFQEHGYVTDAEWNSK